MILELCTGHSHFSTKKNKKSANPCLHEARFVHRGFITLEQD